METNLPFKRKRNAQIIELSDSNDSVVSDNDSDFNPEPPKKKTASKGKVAAAKGKVTAKKGNVAEVKSPKTSAKSLKTKVNKNDTEKAVGIHASSKKRKTDATKAKASSKKIKLGDNAIESSSVDSAPCVSSNSDIISVNSNDDEPPQDSLTGDISKIVSNAKKNYEPWEDEVVIAEATNTPVHVVKNVISLLNKECTIPFIVRYRKEMTGGLLAENIRDIQISYDEVKLVHKKVETILKTVKSEKFDETAATALLSSKTLEEVEFLYAPFKPGSKRTLAERSKQLGLEPLALQLLECKITLLSINFSSYIKQQKGLQNEKEILSGIQHIIADVISKDRRVMDFNRKMTNHHLIRILSAKSSSAEKKDRQAHVIGQTTDNFKYENYFNFNVHVKNVAHHQVMALNRGERQKVLTVKLQIPFEVKKQIKNFIWNTFCTSKYFDPETENFIKNCVQDSYDRLIEPHICRQIRSDLTKKAEKESIVLFCSNVRSLLLTPPVRGKTVVGIDPGFKHGCKIAVISSKGEVLKTDVIYPHSTKKFEGYVPDDLKLKNMVSTYGVEIVAIGNGTACRETELWLSNLINSNHFHPYQVKYCVVNESGISIYSVTKEAETELPNMDPNIRSAVAIARRLQDPLLEYVKIEPKHLGVGMYQHDIPEAQLKKALDSVVEECVSFVGVDLNVCPEFLLKKISGLNVAKAHQIVMWRTQHGSFINREQLLNIKGLGPKSFEQCAGFVKILPETSICLNPLSTVQETKKKNIATHKPNPLDRTIVHPESYDAAEKFLKILRVDPSEIGLQLLVDKVNSYMRFNCTEDIAKSFNIAPPAMQLIIDAFKQLLNYDIRGEFDQPLFMTSVRKFSDLEVNQELTGRVMNIAGFGAFVDVGVEKCGLIHTSKMKGHTVNVGERVSVKVLNIDIQKKRLQLELLNKS